MGVCIRRERVWCVFGSKLGRILQEATRGQLGLGWGDCRGFTVEEMERIDFEAVDLSEFTENLVDGSSAPSIALPEAPPKPAMPCARASAISIPKTSEETTMTIAYALILACLLAVLPASPAEAREWRSWCGTPDAGSPLGWHFYCDRDETTEEEKKGDAGDAGVATP